MIIGLRIGTRTCDVVGCLRKPGPQRCHNEFHFDSQMLEAVFLPFAK